MLLQVNAPHFCAAIVIEHERCVDAAPILRWALNKSEAYLRGYFMHKGYTVEEVNGDTSGLALTPAKSDATDRPRLSPPEHKGS